MSFQQIWDILSIREKLAVKLMSQMKTDDNGYWTKTSLYNKCMYKLARKILGRDPFTRLQFYNSLLKDDLAVDQKDLEYELNLLRIAYN